MAEPRTSVDKSPAQVPFVVKPGPAYGDQHTVLKDNVQEYKGSDGDVQLGFDTTRRAYRAKKNGNYIDFDGVDLSDRLVLVERFTEVPGINADVAPASADDGVDGASAAEIALLLKRNKNFEVLGTGAVSADVAASAEGGIVLTTHGSDDDNTIVLPHLDTGLSAWTTVTWGTDQETRWECLLKLPATITTMKVWAGLKLTNTGVLATDAKQAYFQFSTEGAVSTTKWTSIYSINGTDVETDTGVTATGGASYLLAVEIDSSRVPRFYINGALVVTGTALDDTSDFIPYVGVQQLAGAITRAVTLRWEKISRKYA